MPSAFVRWKTIFFPFGAHVGRESTAPATRGVNTLRFWLFDPITAICELVQSPVSPSTATQRPNAICVLFGDHVGAEFSNPPAASACVPLPSLFMRSR